MGRRKVEVDPSVKRADLRYQISVIYRTAKHECRELTPKEMGKLVELSNAISELPETGVKRYE